MKRKNTAELYYGYNLRLLLIVGGVLIAATLLPIVIFWSDVASNGDGLFALAICIAAIVLSVFLPAVYYLVQYLYYRKAELTDVQEVFLARTDTNRMRNIGFVVEVNVGGVVRTAVTKRVFTATLIGAPLLDEYSGRAVEVGYNPDRDEVVVLAKAEG